MAGLLVAEPVAEAGRDVLAAAHDVIVRTGLSRSAPWRAGGGGRLGRTGRALETRVDAELLEAAAPRLSVIGVASVGTDRIDLAAATRAGVMVDAPLATRSRGGGHHGADARPAAPRAGGGRLAADR